MSSKGEPQLHNSQTHFDVLVNQVTISYAGWAMPGLGEALGLKVIYLKHQLAGQKLTLRELRESTALDFLVAGKQKVEVGVDQVLLVFGGGVDTANKRACCSAVAVPK